MKDVDYLISHGVDVNKSLELFGDMETYNATLPEFLNGVKEKVPQLENYKATADMANYAIIVHSLKSDAKYFGFMELADVAYQHELKSKENDSNYVYQHFDELIEKVQNAVDIANTYLGNEGSSAMVLTPTSPIKKDKKILVVDDSSVIISFVKKIFENEYEVITADDGEQALKIVEQEQDSIAAMLLDIMMPKVNGFGVLEYFKSHNLFTKIPVSVITGAYTKEMVDMVFQYDIVDLLAKPFNEQNVKQIVEKTIHRSEWLSV